MRDGADGHQLPAAYGKGNAVYRRSADECDRGVWPRRLACRQTNPDRSAVRRDGTIGRAQKTVDPALDRSRGGFRIQSPSLADRKGRPLCLRVIGNA